MDFATALLSMSRSAAPCIFVPSCARFVIFKVCNAIGLDGLVIIGGDAP